MKIALTILAQPFYLVVLILRKIQVTALLVSDSFLGRRAIEAVVVGELIGWVVLAVIVAAVLYLALKFVLEGGFFWRLITILTLYAVISVLLYASVNFAHLVSNEMNYVPPAR